MLAFLGKARLEDLFGTNIIYRDLNPVNPALPRFSEAARAVGFREPFPPRKTSEVYAKIILHLLETQTDTPPKQVLFFGDTPGNDGSVIRNLQKIVGPHVYGFIGNEKPEKPPRLEKKHPLFLANRWNLIAAFLQLLPEFGFDPEVPTAVLVDMDKTALGARGRNDALIDAARMDGVSRLIRQTLATPPDEDQFLFIYKTFNQPEYHFLTEDNQDYLAFICLMILGGVWNFDELLGLLVQQKISSFTDFLNRTGMHILKTENETVRHYFEEVLAGTSAGDPTPFKSFRYKEYEATVARIDATSGQNPRDLLQSEILLTGEIVDVLAFLRKKMSALSVFCISDKPPESTFPPPDLTARGARPLHEIHAKIVGTTLITALEDLW